MCSDLWACGAFNFILKGAFYPCFKLGLQSQREAGSYAAGLWPVSSFELFKVNDTVRKFKGSFSAVLSFSCEKCGLYCLFCKCLYLFVYFVYFIILLQVLT